MTTPAAPPPLRGRRLVAAILCAVAIGSLVMLLAVYFTRGFAPGDALVYLAAGERLNAGHQLYALSPGDRPVGLNPPYWNVPLLSPPLIAVIFRPLALLGDAGAYVWWAITIATIVATLSGLVRGAPIATSLAILALGLPLVYEIGVGNMNGIILGGTVLAWWLARERRETLLGVDVAFLSVLKLTPLPLAVWLVARWRRRSIAALLVAWLAFVLVGVAGAGPGASLDYLPIVRATNSAGTSPLSVAGIARAVGVPPGFAELLPATVTVIGLIVTIASRRRPSISYCAAVLTMVFGSPVVNINTPTLLLALLAPVAFPYAVRTGTTDPATGPADAAAGPGDGTTQGTAGTSAMNPRHVDGAQA